MDEEINYSTVVFKNGAPPPRNVNEEVTIYSAIKTTEATEPREKEEVTIYSGIKTVEPLTTKPKKNEDLTVSSGVTLGKPETPVLKVEEAPKCQRRLLLGCLGILCVLLVAIVIIIIYFTMLMNKQEANFSNLMAENQQLTVKKRNLENQTEELTIQRRILENQTKELIVENGMLVNQTEQLMVEKRVLENQTEQLSRDRENLNRTLGFIVTFNNFPVQDFCPGKKCQPCRKNWIQYQNKCYLFYNENYGWKTWTESRKYCQDKAADLVVIDDLDEQKFISNNIQSYHDEFHGYWLGLYKSNNSWVWVDGRPDALQYWNQSVTDSNSYALMIPGTKDTENWSKNEEVFRNKFICEQEVVTWPK